MLHVHLVGLTEEIKLVKMHEASSFRILAALDCPGRPFPPSTTQGVLLW
jgi:hypothetical protein